MSAIIVLGIVLFILMLLVGGKQGLQSFLSLILNFGFLFFAIVLIAFHFPPIIVTVITGVIVLALTIFLSGTDDNTSGLAFLSSILVLFILVLLIIPVEHWAQVQGFGLEDSDDLEGLSILIGINFVKIEIATAILSTLGAIAEATMAIASGLDEIKEQHPKIKPSRLLFDGIYVGKQIIGTTLNTLFFGLFGGSLSLFVWFHSLNYSFGNILNDKVFDAQLIVILFSLIGVILTIPITSLVIAEKWRKDNN
ncbi:YibE/F family protein [Apilactobacillus timberlakei]|uniref:YibE/F family protein n=1 Tax=Apilactobacillus timberlakei TaxID=2008380 RepID=A0ABY2YVR8_9LACO|nr:YibE/F family protein [Apilactobacillus timberlakei]TPR14736.1 YibE/F family protein [Apilactobacillus timberlakei]TPR15703.1 YibE/F family protein [Apilactobacillus timberlakei]TPR16064.1 YibE/F family protein [Apilactobacillus timberlakei]TPR18247.1 YibE/F family protein [Apilactobacillus timberlakei]TPR18807.1 YibE/F family protein [Apilactobacillus timberlakei]